MKYLNRSAHILYVLSAATLSTCLTPAPSLAADPFPADLPGTNIGAGLGLGYETSGVVWHSRLERIFTVDDGGQVSSLDADGGDVQHWNLPGDDEAITVADPDTDFVYVGRERGNTIVEFDFVTGSATRIFDLSEWMTSTDNSGLEALTFVADPGNPEGGLFYAGQQSDGVIYAFQLPLISDPNSTQVSFQFSFEGALEQPARNDLSGMHYDAEQDVLYAIWDSSNLLRAMRTDGTKLAEWELAGNDQEGISFQNTNLLIAQDTGDGNLIRYTSFPLVPEPGSLALSVALAAVGCCWRGRLSQRSER